MDSEVKEALDKRNHLKNELYEMMHNHRSKKEMKRKFESFKAANRAFVKVYKEVTEKNHKALLESLKHAA